MAETPKKGALETIKGWFSKSEKTSNADEASKSESVGGALADSLAKKISETEEKDVEKVDEKEKVKVDTLAKLNALKNKLDVGTFESVVGLDGFEFKDLEWDKPLDEAKAGFLKEMKEFYSKRDLSSVESLIEIDDKEGLNELLANVYAVVFEKQVAKEISERSDFYNEWKEKPENANLKVNYKIVGIPKTTSFKVKFDKEFEDAYQKSLTESKKADDDAKQEEMDIATKVEELKKNPVAKVLGMLFGWKNKGDDGLDGWERLATGNDAIGMFIMGLFGYTAFSDGLYGKVKGLAEGTKFESTFKKLDKMGAKLKKNIQEKVEKIKGKETGVSVTEFQNYVDGKKSIPAEGIKLKEDYVFGEAGRPESLKVSFKKGGKMIVSGPAVFMLYGEDITVPSGEERPYDGNSEEAKDFEIELGMKVPKGTVFSGDVEFLSSN